MKSMDGVARLLDEAVTRGGRRTVMAVDELNELLREAKVAAKANDQSEDYEEDELSELLARDHGISGVKRVYQLYDTGDRELYDAGARGRYITTTIFACDGHYLVLSDGGEPIKLENGSSAKALASALKQATR